MRHLKRLFLAAFLGSWVWMAAYFIRTKPSQATSSPDGSNDLSQPQAESTRSSEPSSEELFRAFYAASAGNIVEIQASNVQGMRGSATGFLMDGLIITNFHVVRGYGRIDATVHGAKCSVSSVAAYDEQKDWAALRSNCTGSGLERGTSKNLKLGDPVLLVGNPSGRTRSYTLSALLGMLKFPSEMDGPLLRYSAGTAPGSSGSPVLNRAGKVIGIHARGIAGAGWGEGLKIDELPDLRNLPLGRPLNEFLRLFPPQIDAKELKEILASDAKALDDLLKTSYGWTIHSDLRVPGDDHLGSLSYLRGQVCPGAPSAVPLVLELLEAEARLHASIGSTHATRLEFFEKYPLTRPMNDREQREAWKDHYASTIQREDEAIHTAFDAVVLAERKVTALGLGRNSVTEQHPQFKLNPLFTVGRR